MNVGLDPLWNLLQNALKPDEDGERAQTNGKGAKVTNGENGKNGKHAKSSPTPAQTKPKSIQNQTEIKSS